MYNCKYTPEEAEARLNQFFEFCEANDEPPDNWTLRKFGITADDVYSWREYTDLPIDGDLTARERSVNLKKRELAGLVKKLDDFREHFWTRRGMPNNGSATTFAMFALKQGHNGGWSDKQDGRSAEINVNIKGVDASMGS